MVDFKNRRSFPRVPISLKVVIHHRKERTPVEVVDITVHGISFKIYPPLRMGAKIWIEFPGSNDIQENKIEARIIRYEISDLQTSDLSILVAKFDKPNDEFLMDVLALVNG